MGLFKVKIKIASVLEPVAFKEDLEAWVDTGAVYTVVPRPILQRCGIVEKTPPKTLISAERKPFERNWGSAFVFIDGVVTTIDVLFGEKDDPALLGCVALEQAGFVIDPVRKKLIPQKFVQQY